MCRACLVLRPLRSSCPSRKEGEGRLLRLGHCCGRPPPAAPCRNSQLRAVCGRASGSPLQNASGFGAGRLGHCCGRPRPAAPCRNPQLRAGQVCRTVNVGGRDGSLRASQWLAPTECVRFGAGRLARCCGRPQSAAPSRSPQLRAGQVCRTVNVGGRDGSLRASQWLAPTECVRFWRRKNGALLRSPSPPEPLSDKAGAKQNECIGDKSCRPQNTRMEAL